MTEFKVINVHGREHVITPNKRPVSYSDGDRLPNANYMNTGMALCGILRREQSLRNFKKSYELRENN